MSTNQGIESIRQKIEDIVRKHGNGKISYYIDKLKITTEKLSSKDKRRKKRKIKPFTHKVTVKNVNQTTSFIIIAISKRGIRTLCTELKNKELRFDVIEIAKEIEYNESNPTLSTRFPVGDSLVLEVGKYLSDVFDCEYELPKPHKQPKHDKGKYTLYFNFTNGFKFVVYARISKVTKKPVIHLEFRMLNNSTIKTKIRVQSLTAARNMNHKNVFEQLFSRQIELAKPEIDYLKVGRFLSGIHGNVKLVEKSNSIRKAHFTKPYVESAGKDHCNYWGLLTPRDVFDHFKSFKIEDDEENSEVDARYLTNLKKLKNRDHFAFKS